MATARFEPSGRLRGSVTAPPDKSISHRAALLGAMSAEPVRITNYLRAADTLSTLEALRAVGALVEEHADGTVVVRGSGLREAREPGGPIDVGNAGTLMRLLPGWLAAQEGRIFVLDGDSSIRRRPVDRIAAPLRLMGADIRATEGRFPPFVVYGTPLSAITYEMPVASAQVKSCVLLAGLAAAGTTSVVEPAPSRDHTERMLAGFGAGIETETNDAGETIIRLQGLSELKPQNIVVPGDPSSAAFPIVAALIIEGSDVTIENVLLNPSRTGLIATLREMGGDIEVGNERVSGGETVGDVRVRASRLKGVSVPESRAPSMIDEYPVLAVAAAFAEGRTHMAGLSELRVKESDRLAAVSAGLAANRVRHEMGPDWLVVEGGGRPGGGTVATHLDHRIAMSFLVLGMAAADAVTVDDVGMIDTSFPDFLPLMARLGASFEAQAAGA